MDRLEAGQAIAGAYVCQSANPGSKVEPKHLVPRFTRRRPSSAAVAAGFAGIPGAKVERREKKKAE